jgi:hypothetical protein
MGKFFKWFLAGCAIVTTTCLVTPKAQEIQEIPADQFLEATPQTKPVNCWPLVYTLEGIKTQGLNVLWQAQNKDGNYNNNQVLFTNDANNWVLLEMNDEIACLLGAGDDFYLLDNRYNQGDQRL